jgi:hypothetical protein
MLLSGSPDCNIDRTFIYQFYFHIQIKKSPVPKKTYRNPIYLAREYKNMIDSGEAKNQADLNKVKSVSRVIVINVLNLLMNDINNGNFFHISYKLCYNLKNNIIKMVMHKQNCTKFVL